MGGPTLTCYVAVSLLPDPAGCTKDGGEPNVLALLKSIPCATRSRIAWSVPARPSAKFKHALGMSHLPLLVAYLAALKRAENPYADELSRLFGID